MALLPFMPMEMKVLQCSFLSGISLKKAHALLRIFQPKIVLFPEEVSQHMNLSGSSSQSFSVFWYKENEILGIKDLKDASDLDIAFDLSTRFQWRKLKQGDMDTTRLDGQLLMDHGKHWLVSSNQVASSSRGGMLLSCGVPDLQRLLVVLSELGIDASMEKGMSSDNTGVIRIHSPKRALIEAQGTRTIISSPDDDLATLIFEAIHTVLDGI
uniref:Uncharacterized protein n=1 Tax=Rhizophora mucronata TaxID=61149 RepID=A0A2P2N2K3_RHIMU